LAAPSKNFSIVSSRHRGNNIAIVPSHCILVSLENIEPAKQFPSELPNMKEQIWAVDKSCEYASVNKRRKRLSTWFTVAIVAIFGTFIGMFTFSRDVLSSTIAPGVTWGVIVEPALIMIALVISLSYYVLIERLESGLGERT
jgi:uncharacterized membrane protein (DUF485 family)